MRKQLFTLVASIALLSAASLCAQTAPATPVPTQLTSAKTIFLGNGGALFENKYGTFAYNSLYQKLSALNRYQLKGAPADAELSFEVSLNIAVSDATNGTSISRPYLNLVIRDVKTHTLLWTLSERISGAFREKSLEKNIDEAVAKIVADLNTLTSVNTATALPASSEPAKTRRQQSK